MVPACCRELFQLASISHLCSSSIFDIIHTLYRRRTDALILEQAMP
jgi:hypothetical protein